MKVAVLGAGLLGVTSAWFLRQNGHDVIVIEKEKDVAMESSFANGGQISVSQSEPWANPNAPIKILKWLGSEKAPLLYRFKFDKKQWEWGLKFFRECLPSRTKKNTQDILGLAILSHKKLKELREKLDLKYDQKLKGILQIYSDEKELESAEKYTKFYKNNGWDKQVLTKQEAIGIEPALKNSSLEIFGATYAKEDESGDPNLFCQALKKELMNRGVEFHFDSTIDSFNFENNKITHVNYFNNDKLNSLKCDAVTVALGSASRFLLAKYNINLDLYPVKGFSITYEIKDTSVAPEVCITDESGKIAISRLGNRLRAAGTAELSDYNTEINEARCSALIERVKTIFPLIENNGEIKKWACLRPATPSNVPIIGRMKYDNLYVNTGHGTLGWTLACGSSFCLSEIFEKRSPSLEFPFHV